MELWLVLLTFGAALLALLFSVFTARKVLKFSEGTDLMKKISLSRRKGANAFLKRQYRIVLVFFGIMHHKNTFAQETHRRFDDAGKLEALGVGLLHLVDIQFFEKEIGKGFKFKVKFQKWLKENPEKTYQDAIDAYHELQNSNEKTKIDKQFQYNQYIRDFFKDNEGKTLDDAIKCWKHKKSLKGHNRYEKSDLEILK